MPCPQGSKYQIIILYYIILTKILTYINYYLKTEHTIIVSFGPLGCLAVTESILRPLEVPTTEG